MSVLIVAWLVRRHGGILRRHGLAFLMAAVLTAVPGSVSGGDFKSLLADAGAIVFGASEEPWAEDDSVRVAQAPEPPPAAVTDAPKPAPDSSATDRSAAERLQAMPKVDGSKTGRDADVLLSKLLPKRTDTAADWYASDECLHGPGEPRALAPCVPPPPCDPSLPPQPLDLVGVSGVPSCGPIYRGPCEPRSERNHHGVFAWCHHLCDRFFDCFYHSK